jgi:poly(glycerol-phosphate) alpha-glucosyltransferase
VPVPIETSVHLPVNSLALKRGGLVTAVMRRANALASSGTFPEVWIEVLGAQPWLESDVLQLRRSGRLAPEVRVRRALESLDPAPAELAPESFPLPQGEAVTYDATRTDHLADGFRTHRVARTARGNARFVDGYRPDGSREQRVELSPHGRAVRDLRYLSGHGRPAVHRWIGRDGGCYLTVEQTRGGTDWVSAYARDNNGVLRRYTDMADVYAMAWTRALAHVRTPVVFSEFRENLPNLPVGDLDDAVLRIQHPGVRRVVAVHSNHLAPPYTRGSDVSPNWQRLLAANDRWDGFVVWTAQQRADLIAQFGVTSPVDVVAPYAPRPEEAAAGDGTSVAPGPDPDRVVVVARVHRKKRVDQAIEIFAGIRRRRPSARLEIFGFGYGDEEEEAVRGLVAERGLDDAVRFMPFSEDPSEIYATAGVLLFTSQSEGFGQVLLEAMAYGVPVVAYDASYGPRDVVVDGENGYLVPFGDTAAAASRAVSVLEQPKLRSALAEGARRTAAHFSEERSQEAWVRLCRDVVGRRGGQ